MSLEIIKAGLYDAVQDCGRYGYQHLGVNPGGAMDSWAMRIANILVGNPDAEAVIEMTFPAARFRFHTSALIAVTGADFSPALNGHKFSMWQPAWVIPGTILDFTRLKSGMYCYLAVHGGFKLKPWLGSCSTNVLAKQGGLSGRPLKAGDELVFKANMPVVHEFRKLPYRAADHYFYLRGAFGCLPGPELAYLTDNTIKKFEQQKFYIHPQSNRMGYRLTATTPLPAPQADKPSEAVEFGTMQLLPNGELMALMADHQTTGGYPRMAVLAQAWRSAFVQSRPGNPIEFKWISLDEAQRQFESQVSAYRQLKAACYHQQKQHEHQKH